MTETMAGNGQSQQAPAASAPGTAGGVRPDYSAEVTRIRMELKALERRDMGLWLMAMFVVWLLVFGVVAPLAPMLPVLVRFPSLAGWTPLELVAAFLAATLVFNAHALWQRRMLRLTREMLTEQLSRAHAAEQLSILDPLTRAYNRRYMDEVMGKELRRADRMKSVVSFVMLDMDDFHTVNERLGHAMGDRLLQEMARLLQETLRSSDTVVRYGGDEFLLVLPDTDAANAEGAIARVRQEVDGWNQTHSAGGCALRFSSGVACYRSGDDLSPVLARADQNMYANKRQRGVSVR